MLGGLYAFVVNDDSAQGFLLFNEVWIFQRNLQRIVEFGAFVSVLPNKDGLLHISQICTDRSQKVTDIINEGQELEVLVADIDKQGRVKLEWPARPVKEKTEATAEHVADVGHEDQE